MKLRTVLARLKAYVTELMARFRTLLKVNPWLAYIIIGGTAFFTVATVGGLVYSAQPAFCARCHEMAPEVNTWQVSSHAKVTCMECHEGARPWNLVHKAASLMQLYLHVRNQIPDQIEIRGHIEDAICERCHTPQREVTASGDIRIPHEEHTKVVGITCTDCHADAAHAGINMRFPELPPNSPERAVIASQMKPDDFRPAMTACNSCHKEKQAALSCESCHEQIATPVNHQRQEWTLSHGSEAMETYNDCLYCHDIVDGKPAVPQARPLLAIRENELCFGCHLERPPTHTDDWALSHRTPADNNELPCLVCHDQERTPGSEAETEEGSSGIKAETVAACSECHTNNHPKPYIADHPDVVRQDGMGQCFACHDARSCSNCHTQRGVNRS